MKRTNTALLVLSASAVMAACSTSPRVETVEQHTRAVPGDLECYRAAPTGSRLGQRVCLTKEQRELEAERSREQVERMQRQGSRGVTKDPGI